MNDSHTETMDSYSRSWSDDSGHGDDGGSPEMTSNDSWTTVIPKKEKQRQCWRKKAVELALSGALVPPIDAPSAPKKPYTFPSRPKPTPIITIPTSTLPRPSSSSRPRGSSSPPSSWLSVYPPGFAKNTNLEVRKVGVMFGGLVPIPTDPSVDPPANVCFNCWRPGHKRRYCPKPEDPNLCFNCGRRGVTMNECPRCSKQRMHHLKEMRQKRGHLSEQWEEEISNFEQQTNVTHWLSDNEVPKEPEVNNNNYGDFKRVQETREFVEEEEEEIFMEEDDDDDFVELLRRKGMQL